MGAGWIPKKNADGYGVIAPTFEDSRGLTPVWRGRLYTATAGALSFFDEEVNTEMCMRGGWYEILSDNAVIGDYLEFSIIDKNDVMGLFEGLGLTVGVDILELKKFVRTEYVNPGTNRSEFPSNGASQVIAGLFLRVAYLSTGADDVKFKITERYNEV